MTLVLAALAVALWLGSAAAARRPAAVSAVTVTQSFPGLDQSDGGGFAPPDVQVAAGPGFVVEMVNLAMRVWRTPGSPAAEVSTEALATLFQTGADGLTDPRVLYDPASGRWLASISDIDAGEVLLAVSGGGDPTGSWRIYPFDAGGDCADQPRLGTADGVIVLAADLFTSCDRRGTRLVGGELWTVSKADVLAGETAPAFSTFGPTRTFSSLTPVQSLSATSTEYVVSVDSPTSIVVHLLAVTGVPPAAVSVRQVAAPRITPLQDPPTAVEPTASGESFADLDTNDDRVLDAVWEQGRLWFSANTACTPTGDTQRRSCGRIAELATPDGTVTWQKDLGLPGGYVFFPTLRPDGAGSVLAVYGESSRSLAPAVAVVARTADGAFTKPALVGETASPGGSSQNGGRWGDYFGAARDPSNPSVVWVAGETGAPAPGSQDWTTVVGSAVATAGSTPPASTPPPRLQARPGSGVAGKPVRLSYVALDDGSGVRRQVTVRSTGRVVFRRTTVPGPVYARRVYGTSWTPPRRLRGSLPFCVRSIAADGTQSAPSCASVRIAAPR